ncbi:conserved hypothetical protein [Vibrio nigripulchritudo MADA3029]|uniref:hypothetical protein n=1 Tax=Vibrio nigripulchritudo TaxID=28173 RepID=UPI0003B21898|nr:hypothetical protein [Vibrio nigripulchritudo]KJY69057.1 hypothetical protein TW74_24720 [Vibrio nigripulchritudo]CCN37148.1 conserved hypothetical protein [Vibrio nigripulchritudo AM115]CCN42629.1 conserved hypothetical protein [Vibrio nigripulchritudo FTn2]CCN48444.1 conserved hypothetical protein [Vibrio nigripulchritudo MADA3020]CCN52216.1 conserved hypothetical protein [Vibrio nigripulchritudo MADA3021]
MDKELLARRLYVERVTSLVGNHDIDEDMLNQLWEEKATPSEAANALMSDDSFQGPAWLERYLNRK